ncbi:MAG: hypothetical protein K1X36_01230 [Pyrinomonadaceae bacterium]|nr:hypothetical protein [Pyrinomonadaceae bacterium]
MTSKLVKRDPGNQISPVSQIVLTSSVAGVLMLSFGVPYYVVFFLGAFAFLLLKIFTSGRSDDVRQIFEFYLSANDILRQDGRRWFGFEIAETIALGERITRTFEPPPLVVFTLGALYLRTGDRENASKCFESLYSEKGHDESSITEPHEKLREYVRTLRKIEREPAEAPKMSAAIRSLERMRRLRGDEMRRAAREPVMATAIGEIELAGNLSDDHVKERKSIQSVVERADNDELGGPHRRKTISEVLQDIYDDKVN